jgi:hypothetical protein
LASRKRTVFAEPEWIELPFTQRDKTAVDSIVDLLLILPSILEDFDISRSSTVNTELHRRARRLHTRCSDLNIRLNQWKDDFVAKFLSGLFWNDVELCLPCKDRDLEKNLLDAGLDSLYALSLYWSCCVVLHSLSSAVYHIFPPAPDIKVSPLEPQKYARAIARNVTYFLHPETGLASATAVAFPICCICQSVYYMNFVPKSDATSRYYAELQNSLGDIEIAAKGTWVAPFINDIFGQRLPENVEFHGRVERWPDISSNSTATSFSRLLPVPLAFG